MKLLILSLLLITAIAPQSAGAAVFYQSRGGNLVKITEDAFKNCTTFIFRESGKDDLSEEFKRKCLIALLKGDAINDAKSAAQAAKQVDGTCTYSDKDDLK